jgi:hypothetical protein
MRGPGPAGTSVRPWPTAMQQIATPENREICYNYSAYVLKLGLGFRLLPEGFRCFATC